MDTNEIATTLALLMIELDYVVCDLRVAQDEQRGDFEAKSYRYARAQFVAARQAIEVAKDAVETAKYYVSENLTLPELHLAS